MPFFTVLFPAVHSTPCPRFIAASHFFHETSGNRLVVGINYQASGRRSAGQPESDLQGDGAVFLHALILERFSHDTSLQPRLSDNPGKRVRHLRPRQKGAVEERPAQGLH